MATRKKTAAKTTDTDTTPKIPAGHVKVEVLSPFSTNWHDTPYEADLGDTPALPAEFAERLVSWGLVRYAN